MKMNLIAALVVAATVLPAFGQGAHPFQISENTWQMCQEEGIMDYEECVLAKAAVSYTGLKAERDELRTENAHLRGQVADLEDENAQLRGRVSSLEDSQSRLEGKLDELLAATAASEPASPAPSSRSVAVPGDPVPTEPAPSTFAPAPAPRMAVPAAPSASASMADPMSVAWTSEPRNHEFAALTGMTWESCEDMGLCTAFINHTAYSISIDVGGVRTVIGRAHGATTVTPAPTTHGAETLIGPGQRVYLYVGATSFDATYTAYAPLQGTFVPTATKTVTNVRTKGANPFKGIGRTGWSSL